MPFSQTSRLSQESALNFGLGAFTTNPFTVGDNCLLVAKVYVMEVYGNTNPSGDLTLAKTGGGGPTFTRQQNAGNANSWSIGCAIFTAEVTTGGTWQLDFDCGGRNIYVYGVQVTEYASYKTSGFIGGVAADGNGPADGAFNLTLSQTPLSTSYIESICGGDGPNAGTGILAGSGWTNLFSNVVIDGYEYAVETKTNHTSTTIPWDDVANGGTSCFKSIAVAIEILAETGAQNSLFYVKA